MKIENTLQRFSCISFLFKPTWSHFVIHLFFYKKPVDKQLALGWQIAKQLSGLNLLSLSDKKTAD